MTAGCTRERCWLQDLILTSARLNNESSEALAMGKKDSNHQIIYRGQVLERFTPGGWVFFQRPKECGGGFWLGRTYEDCFWLELEFPVSLYDGLGVFDGDHQGRAAKR